MSQKRFFWDMVRDRWAQGTMVCVGIDIDLREVRSRIPKDITEMGLPAAVFKFTCNLIDATHDLVCAYKPNSAFFEAMGMFGTKLLVDTIAYIHQVAPDVPVILDVKRADIGHTTQEYADAAFRVFGADAVTVNPYLGKDAVEPFLMRPEKGVIVLCRTSNPGAGEFQDLQVNDRPLYLHVAQRVRDHWNERGNCGLVVGATSPKELALVRELVPELPFLVPGVGAQQGDVAAVLRAGLDAQDTGLIINSSRGIIYAGKGEDYATMAREKTLALRDLIRAQALLRSTG